MANSHCLNLWSLTPLRRTLQARDHVTHARYFLIITSYYCWRVHFRFFFLGKNSSNFRFILCYLPLFPLNLFGLNLKFESTIRRELFLTVTIGQVFIFNLKFSLPLPSLLLKQGVYTNTTSTAARTSSENVTSRFRSHFWIIQSHHGCKMCPTYPGSKLEPALQRKILNICHHVLTSSSQLQNRSFHVVERTRTSAECPKMKNARAKRANLMFFTVKYASLWRSCCRCRRGCVNSLAPYCLRAHVWR